MDLEILATGAHLRMVRREGWEYVDRIHVSGIVGIVAVTDEGKLLLVEQHRPPVGGPVIEIPAGLVGDVRGQEDEDLLSGARRELLEETGYEAGRMEVLASGPASAGVSSEIITVVRATNLRRVGQPEGDGEERITLHEVPLAEVEPWLRAKAGQGTMVDLKVYAALYFAGLQRAS